MITIGAGETITLNGVDASSLNANDFVFDQTPVTENAGSMAISDGAVLPLSGVVNNTGTIALNSTGDATDLELIQHGITLQGGGALTLSDSSANAIFGTDPSVTLTNVDNTISGAGQIGEGQMTLVNDGTIDATGTNALVLDTGSNVITNSGTLEATGSWRADRQQCDRQFRQPVGGRGQYHLQRSGYWERNSDDFGRGNHRIRRRIG